MNFRNERSEEFDFDPAFLTLGDDHQEQSISIARSLIEPMEEEQPVTIHDNQSHISADSETVNLVSSQSKSFHSRKISPFSICIQKPRRPHKPRTTITEQILIKINNQLRKFHRNIQSNLPKARTLKSIAKSLNIGYRTLLSKYKEFKAKGEVTGGIRLSQEPSSYNKSLELTRIITKSLNYRRFKSTVQLCNYINRKYKIAFNRTRISNYHSKIKFKDSLSEPIKIGTEDEERAGSGALPIYLHLIQNQDENVVYYAEEDYQNFEGEKVRVLILCSKKYIQTHIMPFINEKQVKEMFLQLLSEFLNKISCLRNWLLVSNVRDIYQRVLKSGLSGQEKINIEERLIRMQGTLFCLPLGYEGYSPAQFYCQLNRKSNHLANPGTLPQSYMQSQLLFYKKTFSSTFPILIQHISSSLVQQLGV